MQQFKNEEYNLKLIDKVFCKKCKSKSLEVHEEVESSNIYTTDENGVVQNVEIYVYETITPIKLRFLCLKCGHSFKKINTTLLNDAMCEKE